MADAAYPSNSEPQVFETDPLLFVCPSCGATKGKSCRSKTTGWDTPTHRPRWNLLVEYNKERERFAISTSEFYESRRHARR